MMPLRDELGAAAQLPTSVLTKFGYAHEFDDAGALGNLHIDFETLAAHLSALERSAARHHVEITRVILEPSLRRRLSETRAWPRIARLPFMLESAWVRHDEHYHVDFGVSCRPLSDVE
jgi:penicillin-insensitive murein endopeptidase